MDVEGNGFRNELSADDVAQTDANLRLASQFIEEFLNAPDEFEPIPRGSAVILLPPTDSDEHTLREMNLAMAQRLAEQGRNVVFWTVGSEESPPQVTHLAPLDQKPA